MTLFLLLLAAGALGGALLWRRLAPGLRRLEPGSTAPEGVAYALIGWLGVQLLTTAAVHLARLPDPPPLQPLLALNAGAALLMAALVIALAARRGGADRLGLRRAGGPPAPLVALAAWLVVLPAVSALGWLNGRVLELFGRPQEQQSWIREFLNASDSQTSLLTWLPMAVLLPACEELFFRGGLYGGLRRVLAVPAAVALAAGAFGVVHDPGFFLPTAALGAVLCVLYERTGSLAAPLCFHVLHNGATLALVSARPDLVN